MCVHILDCAWLTISLDSSVSFSQLKNVCVVIFISISMEMCDVCVGERGVPECLLFVVV